MAVELIVPYDCWLPAFQTSFPPLFSLTPSLHRSLVRSFVRSLVRCSFVRWLVVGLPVTWVSSSFVGSLVRWFVGWFVCWCVGSLVRCFVGLLFCLFVGWFVGWIRSFVGLLVLFARLLVRWCMCLLARVHSVVISRLLVFVLGHACGLLLLSFVAAVGLFRSSIPLFVSVDCCCCC